MDEERKRDEHKGINERTEGEQRLAAVLREGLEQEIGEIPEVSINIDELKQLEAADRKTRKIKRLRTISVAAAAVIVCAAIIYTVLPESVVPVDADKNTKQKVEEKDGMVIINEGDGIGEIGAMTWSETNWKKVDEIKELVPDILIPQYVPENYEFIVVTLEKFSEGYETYECIYKFKLNNDELNITIVNVEDSGVSSGFIDEATKRVNCKLGTIYLSENKNGLTGTLFLEKTRISIFGKISQFEMRKIFNELK